jgi:hypothetical protein
LSFKETAQQSTQLQPPRASRLNSLKLGRLRSLRILLALKALLRPHSTASEQLTHSTAHI